MKLFSNTFKMTNRYTLLVILLSIISYYLFAYTTVRTNFPKVLSYYSLLFIGFAILYQYSNLSNRTLLIIGVLFRFIFLVATPNLSDDFYRFLWDGRALLDGINPYLVLPENNPNLIAEGSTLYQGMGTMNGSHYTCYPPLNQFAFGIPALFAPNHLLTSTIVLRITLILSDLVTLYFGIKLLKHFKLDSRKIFLYFLNPFIIIELTGNLHYEGMMIAFLAASLYFLFRDKNNLSAILFAAAVSIKLIPLIFLPVFYKKLGFKKWFIYGSIVCSINVLLFLPFLSQDLIDNFMSSIELYFQNFEFNASIYYIVREIGYRIKGYNIIHTVGRITPLIIIAITLLISFVRKNEKKTILFTSMLWIICSYYFLSSIVHPWYIAIPLFLSLFTKFNFPLVWSYAIVLSYSAYISSKYHENLWLVGLEYILVLGWMVVELTQWKLISKLRS
ncbi:glycosyltransferase 87 family protein [Wenyingzhuangia sp. 1_MG-2023]|nr:glycosyltransferase 87 family protein [Wenyingzhuangia sp. 1_MG-2023]